MKNKEIEELLNELKRRNERYNYCKNNDISFSDEDYKSYLLLSYIEQLENNRDKAIEEIHDIYFRVDFKNLYNGTWIGIKLDETAQGNELINILKGDSDE